MPTITDPAALEHLRLLTLSKALYLETKGMKRSRGPSALTIIKREFGFKGNAQSVYDQLKAKLQEKEDA